MKKKQIHLYTLAELERELDQHPITTSGYNTSGTLKKYTNDHETGYMFITPSVTYARTTLDSLILQMAFGHETYIEPQVVEGVSYLPGRIDEDQQPSRLLVWDGKGPLRPENIKDYD